MKKGLRCRRISGGNQLKGGPVVKYVGIDWGYGQAAWCARRGGGEIAGEGRVSADAYGLAQLVCDVGLEVRACVEMMSGAVWVRDQLAACGWQVQIADARRAKALAPLTSKTDRVDARVLAELARRDLVPAVWVPPLAERELRERLRRRMHLVRLRTSCKARIFGVLSQWGVRVKLTRLRHTDGLDLLDNRGVPAVWRRSVAEAIGVIDQLDERIDQLDRELAPLFAADPRAQLLATIPGVGRLLALTLAAEIGDVSRFASPRKLVGYSGLSPRVRQSGQSDRTGKLTKAGPRTLRWAAVEAAQSAWRPSNPWHRLYTDVADRHGSGQAKAAVARKILIAAWHILARGEPFKPSRPHGGTVPASSTHALAA
jgi:transposase